MCQLTEWGESFHSIHLYQITTMYTLAILQFYVSMSYISKADFKKESKTSGEKKNLRERLALPDHTILQSFWAMPQVRRKRRPGWG